MEGTQYFEIIFSMPYCADELGLFSGQYRVIVKTPRSRTTPRSVWVNSNRKFEDAPQSLPTSNEVLFWARKIRVPAISHRVLIRHAIFTHSCMNLFLKICHRIRRRQSRSGSFSFKTVIDNLSTCRAGKVTENFFSLPLNSSHVLGVSRTRYCRRGATSPVFFSNQKKYHFTLF